jgi:acetyl-CoA decarbonylase/synthase, CODH/ACS complex subunit beta
MDVVDGHGEEAGPTILAPRLSERRLQGVDLRARKRLQVDDADVGHDVAGKRSGDNCSVSARSRHPVSEERTRSMQHKAVEELMALLPPSVGRFEGSQFPLPTKTALVGNAPLSIEDVRDDLRCKRDGDVKHLIEPVLLGAELVEASRPDRQDFFLSDARVQGLVFTGSKWRAGWVLVLGDNRRAEHVRLLQEREFLVFTDHPGLDQTIFIGARPTSPVYFLQLMVRYGLIWGRINPGDDHSMGHFLETDMPGFVLITENLPALKYLVVLGLMKLGAPAVVPTDYPFPYGNYSVASGPEAAVEAGCLFPNLRRRYEEDEVIGLPSYCNPASAHEEFAAASRLGGTAPSFFFMRKAEGSIEDIIVEGEPGRDIGILVEVDHPEFSPDVANTIEADAVKAVNFMHGVHAYVSDGTLTVEVGDGVRFEPAMVAEAIRQGIRFKYPRLKGIGVRLIWERARLLEEAGNVALQRQERERLVAEMTEESTEEFGVCTECRPFSMEHTCILTPDRLPMCASRTYHSVKAAALFGSTVLPYKRRSDRGLPLRLLVPKGTVIDAAKGEYEGVNRVCASMTDGRLTRVQLHSLRQFPPTSCGCFQNLAFWIEPVAGIGIMSRNSEAVAPDGSRWFELANRAGGKQTPGILGVSTSHIRSRHFMKGDGGLGNVVWMDQKLKDKLIDIISPGVKVATENDVRTVQELRAFVGR